MAVDRVLFVDTASVTTLSADITSSAPTFTSVAGGGVGYSTGQHVITFERGTANEEKKLCTRAGDTWTVVTHGYGGTTPRAHIAGSTIEHTISGKTIDELNRHAADPAQDDHTQYHNDARGDARYINEGQAAGGVLAGTYPNPSFAVDMATQAELDAHLNDISDAHDATAISYAGSTTLSSTDVEAALDELDTEKSGTAHLHDATYINEGQAAGGVLAGTYPDPTFDLTDLINIIYPVGSLYFNYSNADNPATLLGVGTWVAIAGRTIVGLDAAQIEFDVAGEVGGVKAHALSVAEMPLHDHGGPTGIQSANHEHNMPDDAIRDFAFEGVDARNGVAAGRSTASNVHKATGGQSVDHTHPVTAQGGGAAHTNLQPYVVVHVWRRTA